MINENVSFESRFSFTAVSEDDIQREILNLNPKKTGTFGNIPGQGRAADANQAVL